MINPLKTTDILWYNSELERNKITTLNQNRFDVDENTQLLFRETLKMHRRGMKPHIRKRTQSPGQGATWLYPFATERQYQRYIFDLMDVYALIAMPTVRQNIDRWVAEARDDSIKTDQFNDEFQRMITEMNNTQDDMFDEGGDGVDGKRNFFNRASILAALTGFAISVSDFNKKQQDKFTKIVLGQPFNPIEPFLDNVIKAWANNNFILIQSLTIEYIKKTNTIVADGIAAGNPSDEIMRELRKMNKNMTRSRATLIARDQVGKLNGQLTRRRNQEMGLNFYKWVTALDERVRSTHKPLHNKIMTWNDNSIFADSIAQAEAGNWQSRSSINGFIGIPGQDVQCRCTSVPQFAEMIQAIDEELDQELIAA